MQTQEEAVAGGSKSTGGFDAEVDAKVAEVVRAVRCAVDAFVGLDCSFAEPERVAVA